MIVSFNKIFFRFSTLDYLKILSLIIITLTFAQNALAISLSNSTPKNGSYMTGGAIYNFSILVLNSSASNTSVKLHFGSQEVWPGNRNIYNMSCNEINESTLLCYKEIEIVAAESGTKEYYFFEAFENGNYISMGNLTSPLFVTIDRLPPRISALNFVNNSYISTNKIIEVSIEDIHSGVDNSSVIAFVENNGTIKIQNIAQVNGTKNWRIKINTTDFYNNDSIKIYVNASDILGNKNTSLLGFAIIDNEAPEMNLLLPKDGEEIRGIYYINISLLERYSGLDKVIIKVGNFNFNSVCQKINDSFYSCFHNLNTSLLADGNYSLQAIAFDNSNNSAINSITISIDNKKPSLYIESPTYARGISQINASILGRRDIVTGVFIKIESVEDKMNCDNDFSYCSYSINTSKFKDGVYGISIYAKNLYNYSVNATRDIIIDNTQPSIILTQDFSQIYIKGHFSFYIIVTDESPLEENEIKLRNNNREIKLNCTSTLQGRRMQCGGTIDSRIFLDGKNRITFLAKDFAGNLAYRDVDIIVDNNGPDFINLIINPVYSENPTNIYFEAIVRDNVSGVNWVKLIIRARNETFTIGLQNRSNWISNVFISTLGKNYVDLQASDINNNTKYYANVGYFFIGKIVCGDSICQENENYCLCKEDCDKPSCGTDEDVYCNAGIPKCVKLNICGNGICEANENCKNCQEDCGICENDSITTTIKVDKNEEKIVKDKKVEEKSGVAEQVSIIVEEIIFNLIENPYLVLVIVLAVVIFVILFIKIKGKKKHIIIVKFDKELT